MTRRSQIVITLTTIAVLGALLGPNIVSRLQWYGIDNGWNGATRLVVCHSGTPLFANAGLGFGADLPSERTARFDAWIACKSISAHRQILTSHQHFDGNNAALLSLATMRSGCLDRRFDKAQVALCESAISKSIDWLLEEGVEINPVDSCGYLRVTFADVLDAKMFEFLLSRGASVETECPRQSSRRENRDGEIDSAPSNVIDDLKLNLSWLDVDEFPDEATQFADMIELAEASLDNT